MNYVKTVFFLVILAAILIYTGGMIGGATGAMVAFIISMVINGISYWYSDKIVLAMYRAEELSREKHPAIYETVENLSKKAEIPCPRVYMVPMDAPNAFATGRSPYNAALCITKGALELLDRDELRGVISHEIAHILNRDTLIMTVTASLASAIMMIANMARWATVFGGSSRRGRDSGNVFVLIVLSILAPLAALLVQMAVSRSREYAADAEGAMISKDPGSLARALEDLARYAEKKRSDIAPQTAHLFIVQPVTGEFFANLFSTHPPLKERVRRLRSMA